MPALIVVLLGLLIGGIALIARRRAPTAMGELIWPDDEPRDPDEPVAVMRNLHEAEAELMSERLKSAGIPSFVRGLRTSTFWRRINVEVCVASRDAERALAMLVE